MDTLIVCFPKMLRHALHVRLVLCDHVGLSVEVWEQYILYHNFLLNLIKFFLNIRAMKDRCGAVKR